MASAIFNRAAKQSKRVTPICDQVDKYTYLGALLLNAQSAVDPLERFLLVLRLAMTLATAVVKEDTGSLWDVIMPGMAYHIIGTLMPVLQTLEACWHVPEFTEFVTIAQVRVQEICSFDSQERPRSVAGTTAGNALAVADVIIDPFVKVKTKKLGREELVKVQLGGGFIKLDPQNLPLSNQSQAAQTSQASSPQEVYQFTLPSLVLRDPLSSACHPSLKGDISIACEATGLSAVMTLAEIGTVEGYIDTRKVTNSSSTSTAGNAGSTSAAQKPAYVRLGEIAGSWVESDVTVEIPGLGLTAQIMPQEGLRLGSSAGSTGAIVSPGLLGSVASGMDLTALKPMQFPRLWSALNDALIFNNPKNASGKGAMDVARTLGRRCHAYPLGYATQTAGAAAADTTTRPGAPGKDPSEDYEDALLMMSSKGGGSQAGGGGGGGASSVTGAAAGGDRDYLLESRRVPPCVMEQHVLGNRLKYQLQLQVLNAPHSDLRMRSREATILV